MTCLTCNVDCDTATRKTLHWLPLRASGGTRSRKKKSCCSHTTSAIHQKWKFTRDVGEHDMTICHKMSKVNMWWGDVESPHRRSAWLQIQPLFCICIFAPFATQSVSLRQLIHICLVKYELSLKFWSWDMSFVYWLGTLSMKLKTVLKLCIASPGRTLQTSTAVRFTTFVIIRHQQCDSDWLSVINLFCAYLADIFMS